MQTRTDISPPRQRFGISSLGVDQLNRELLFQAVSHSVATREKQRVIFCNVSSVVEAESNPDLREAINGAQLVSPDGMPLVWLAKLRGKKEIERCDGPTFMKRAMREGAAFGWRHYLYGGTPAVLENLISKLEAEIEGVKIVGAEAPPFRPLTPEEEATALQRIRDARPDLVWVGLGMPKQEIWMARQQAQIDAPVLLGVGAAFDFHAGVKKRAPLWMQRSGLEWLHRFMQEPGRLWRRYLTGNVQFLYFVARDLVSDPLQRLRRSW